MAEYYRSDIRSAYDVAARRQHPLLTLLDGLFIFFSLLSFVALILTLIAPTVAPKGWFFPVLSLMAPVTFLLHLLFTLYWIIRWRWLFATPMLLLLLGVSLFSMDHHLRLPIARDYGDRPKGRSVVKMISYNVRQFYGPDGESSMDSIATWLNREQPHILCLQEFMPREEEGGRARFDSLLESRNMRYHFTEGDTTTTLAIYSRYKILRSGRTCPSLKGFRSIWADLVVGRDTLRLYNNHLHTTAITRADDDFLSRDQFLLDTAREEKVRSIVQRFSDNTIERAIQVDTLLQEIARTSRPVILAGDFNDTPLSNLYHRLAKGRRDVFREVGRGYSHTFLGFSNMLRIDYLLFPPSIELLDYEEQDTTYSDHRAIIAWFKRN